MKKNTKIIAVALAAALATAATMGLAGCTTGTNKAKSDMETYIETGLTGGVAAKVNDADIEEDRVTKQINTIRYSNKLTEEGAWGQYLAVYQETPESLRESILDDYIDQELILQFADQEGVAATDEEIQAEVDKMRGRYSSDEAWQSALESSGYADVQAYKDALKYQIAYKKLDDKFKEENPLTDELLIQRLPEISPSYDTAKRSSHILFSKDDKQQAEDVLAQINAGTLDFADAARQYSTDTGSAQNGGDVGWDRLVNYVEQYQTALNGLEVGQVSELVETDYGYHIIKCTEEFHNPETLTSLSQIPDDLLLHMRTMMESRVTGEAREKWIEDRKSESEITINPMPENVPYNLDMSKYEGMVKQADENADENEKTLEDLQNTEFTLDDLEAATGAGSNSSDSSN